MIMFMARSISTLLLISMTLSLPVTSINVNEEELLSRAENAMIQEKLEKKATLLKNIKLQEDANISCLVRAVYYESGIEDNEGQKAVASVILNRIKYRTYGIKWKDICHVVHFRVGKVCAFTWACDTPSRPDKKTLDEIKKIVYPLYANFKNNKPYDNTEKSTYFHNFTVSPNWAEELIKTKIIGNHIFYRRDLTKT